MKVLKILGYCCIALFVIAYILRFIFDNTEARKKVAGTYYTAYSDGPGGQYYVLWDDGTGFEFFQLVENGDTTITRNNPVDWDYNEDKNTISITTKSWGDKSILSEETAVIKNGQFTIQDIFHYKKVNKEIYTQEQYKINCANVQFIERMKSDKYKIAAYTLAASKLKDTLNDPGSLDVDKYNVIYHDNDDSYTVFLVYRANNAFGTKAKDAIEIKVTGAEVRALKE